MPIFGGLISQSHKKIDFDFALLILRLPCNLNQAKRSI